MAGIPAFNRALAKDMKAIKRQVLRAANMAARDGAKIARDNAPVAFETLRDGIGAEKRSNGAAVVSVAPHAAAAEVGSRPHRPPFGPILAWVRLRGMQGLSSRGGGAGRFVAGAIRARGTAESTPVDAAEQIAWAIVAKISKEGTKPTLYMARTVDPLVLALDKHVKDLLAEEADGEPVAPLAPATTAPPTATPTRRASPPRARDQQGRFLRRTP